MASEKLGTLPPQHMQNGLSSHPHPPLVYPEFACGPQSAHRRSAVSGDPGPKSTTRELTASFLDHHHHLFQNHHPAPPPRQTTEFRHHWANSRSSATNSGSEDHDSDDEDDDEDDDNDHEDNNNNNNHGSIASLAKINHTDSIGTSNNDQKMKQLAVLGMKEGNLIQIGNGGSNDNNSSEAKNIGEVCYTQYLQGAEGLSSSSGQKDKTVENGCEDGRRKESCYSSESNEPLRTILSDPLTGALMDDAMILPCGHSFGSGGIQQIIRMKACYTCSQSVSEDSIAPNLSLRLAVQAFRREQQLQVNRASKKRKERYDHEKGTCGDSTFTDHHRGRGVQFPFSVRDRVIIKGNKRTPPRFVGREAIVTTQCLNGWYVVKTLDNAESVKLQYRSLAKVGDAGSSNCLPVKMIPNWL